MLKAILPPFIKFPKEAAVIGRMLAGYTLLEVDLMNCVSVARDDLDVVLKALFRTRGETQRIDVADALGRQLYHGLKLGNDFAIGIGGMRHALKIRNQFAHCTWHNDNTGSLGFVEFETLAKGNKHIADLKSLKHEYVDLALLQDQEAFFVWVSELLTWGTMRVATWLEK